MAFFRTFAAATLAAALGVAGTASYALADPPPWAHGGGHGKGHSKNSDDQGNPQGNPRSHATVSGTIVGVDYGSASLLVETPRGVVPVAVTPTTSIFHGSTFASFSDLGRGAHVSIDVTEIDGRLIAQIIRIR